MMTTSRCALDAGRWFKLTLDNGKVAEFRLRVWLMCLAGDYPFVQLCLPFAESVAAHSLCRHCHYNRVHAAAREPHSAFRGFGKCVGGLTGWKERTWESTRATLAVPTVSPSKSRW